jgi:hypothetical protein
VLPTIIVGIAPNAVVGVIAAGGIVVVAVIEVVPPAGDVKTGPGIAGTPMEGEGRGGTESGGGAGMVESGRTDENDVAGSSADVSAGTVTAFAVLEETAGTTGAGAIDGTVPVVPPAADMEATGTAGIPGVICPVGVEQVTTVPGVVGSEANGTGISVVSGAPCWVVAENGLGPFRGDVTIAPGVDGRPMAVLPMVETCARQVLQPNSRATAVNS